MKTVKIFDQNHLRDFFQNNTLYLEKNSNLQFNEDLKIGNNIEFSGVNIFGVGNKIFSNCIFENVKIGNKNTINYNSIIKDTKIKNGNFIGPFCFIRGSCEIGSKNNLGTFVELKKSKIINNNKLAHNIYIGDCEIKSNNIIGAGVITANYSNNKINLCKIGSNNFIGCNSTLISPLKLANNVIIAAGCKINFDIKSNTKIIQKNLNYFSK